MSKTFIEMKEKAGVLTEINIWKILTFPMFNGQFSCVTNQENR